MSSKSPAPPEQVLTAWLHVSDIHFGHGKPSEQWDQKLITNDIVRDIRERLKEGRIPPPRHIFVTGDIAFSGGARTPVSDASEYELATKWFDELTSTLSLHRREIFIVPGNHDIDRSVDTADRDTRRLIQAARDGNDPLDDLLQHEQDVARLRQRMARFLDFAAKYGPDDREPFLDGLWWRHRLDLAEGVALRLCGFNTALLAAGDGDKGKLRVGNRQLADLLVPPPGDLELVFALTHHPLADKWLADESPTSARFNREAAIHLFGHIHAADSEQARHGWGTGCLRIAAGAAHAEGASPGSTPIGHGYSFGALVLLPTGELEVRIWPRRWSSKTSRFVLDSESVDESKGYAAHLLSHRIHRGAGAMTLAPGLMLGERYRLLEKVGQGGVGQVWKAEDSRNEGTVVAIKVLNPDGAPSPPDRREAFFRGPSAMARVNHGSIVKIRDPHPDPEHRHGPYDFYVMDFIDGQDLRRSRRECSFTEIDAITALLAICDGLQAAHAAGLVHRDLKPSNIIQGRDRRLTIVDFDTVRDEVDATRTRSGKHLVSDIYASPEVLDGRTADRRADIYSLAVIGMFLLRGADPPKSKINRMHEFALELNCTPALRDLLAKASAHDSQARHDSVESLQNHLRNLAAPDPTREDRAQVAADVPINPDGTLDPWVADPGPPPQHLITQGFKLHDRASLSEAGLRFDLESAATWLALQDSPPSWLGTSPTGTPAIVVAPGHVVLVSHVIPSEADLRLARPTASKPLPIALLTGSSDGLSIPLPPDVLPLDRAIRRLALDRDHLNELTPKQRADLAPPPPVRTRPSSSSPLSSAPSATSIDRRPRRRPLFGAGTAFVAPSHAPSQHLPTGATGPTAGSRSPGMPSSTSSSPGGSSTTSPRATHQRPPPPPRPPRPPRIHHPLRRPLEHPLRQRERTSSHAAGVANADLPSSPPRRHRPDGRRQPHAPTRHTPS